LGRHTSGVLPTMQGDFETDTALVGLQTGGCASGNAALPWGLPLVGSLLRGEALAARSPEKVRWLLYVLAEVETDFGAGQLPTVPPLEVR